MKTKAARGKTKTHARRALALSPDRNSRLSFDLFLCVCSSRVFFIQELEEIARLALKYDLFIISDEVCFWRWFNAPGGF